MNSWMMESIAVLLTSKKIIFIIVFTLMCHLAMNLWLDYYIQAETVSGKYSFIQEAINTRLLRHSNKASNAILILGLVAIVKVFKKERNKLFR
ncbi:hypothetical protein A9Q81_24210 [Gammaproteobacteria bacterium 42_54_T18]|nr:hypothetical protein A9Q81_24210 [Gammaproteobacteria bacterium 42_54_T18]